MSWKLISLHIRSMWETICDAQAGFWLVSTYVVCERLSVMHKQVSGWTVNFCPNFPESSFLEFQTRKPPPPPISENFRFEMIKVYSGISPPFRKTSDLRWPKFTLKYPPPPFQKTSDLRWPKFTLEYPPPISENFRFGMTKVYSEIPPSSENAGDRMWGLICNP